MSKKKNVDILAIKISTTTIPRYELLIVKKLLLMGVCIKIKKKENNLYKAWIYGYSHHYSVSNTVLSAYRGLFSKIRNMGVLI